MDIQDDMPEAWSITTALGMFGMSPAVKVVKPTIDPEAAKEMFSKLLVQSP